MITGCPVIGSMLFLGMAVKVFPDEMSTGLVDSVKQRGPLVWVHRIQSLEWLNRTGQQRRRVWLFLTPGLSWDAELPALSPPVSQAFGLSLEPYPRLSSAATSRQRIMQPFCLHNCTSQFPYDKSLPIHLYPIDSVFPENHD